MGEACHSCGMPGFVLCLLGLFCAIVWYGMLWRDANHAVVDRTGAGGSMHSECRMGNFDDF